MNGLDEVPAARLLRRIAVLRWLTMIGYSMSYVVIPTLVFDRTRSVTAAGAALLAEGILRTLLALAAGRVRGLVGSRNVVHAAEVLKFCALALLGLSLFRFSLATVVLASFLYQFGYSLSLLEQELRCGTLGADAPRGQSTFRISEMLAVPPVLVVALVSQRYGVGLEVLVACAALASLVHHGLWHRWMRPLPAASVVSPELLADAARFIAGDRMMRGGIVASLIGYGFFSWTLLATPFVFDGRNLLGLAVSSAAGNALFKGLVSASCLLGTLVWARAIASPWADRIMMAVALATPAVFLLALTSRADAVALAAGCAAVAMATGVATWQRSWRLRHAPDALRGGVTTLYLSAECLGMVCAGLALLLNANVVVCGAAAALTAWHLRSYWTPPATRASAPSRGLA